MKKLAVAAVVVWSTAPQLRPDLWVTAGAVDDAINCVGKGKISCPVVNAAAAAPTPKEKPKPHEVKTTRKSEPTPAERVRAQLETLAAVMLPPQS